MGKIKFDPDEEDATARLHSVLTEAGFNFVKFADKSTQGIPDACISINHFGFFAEIKFLKVEKVPKAFRCWNIITYREKMTQLVTAIKMEESWKCRYIMIYRLVNTLYLCDFSPIALYQGFRKDEALSIPELWTLPAYAAALKTRIKEF